MATWMLVEDEPGLYEMVLAMYEIIGVRGVSFINGEDAVAWIEAVDAGQVHNELPELAMLDIRLPGYVSGVDVGARLRQSHVLGNIGIVVMTAYKLAPFEEQAVINQAGADLFLYKPLPPHRQLSHMLQDIIASR